MNSATVYASIHFKLSIPLASLDCKIRFNKLEALSSPSALVNTERIYSSESKPKVLLCSTSVKNSLTVLSTCSRPTDFKVAMAAPSFCTSFGLRYFITSAASSSPKVSINTALLITPASLIFMTHFHLSNLTLHLRPFLGCL